MKWHLCLVIALLVQISTAYADQEEQEMIAHPPLVEVYTPDDHTESYQERRKTHGGMFSVNYHSFLPTNYLSTLDNGTFAEVYGEDAIPMFEASLAYKLNFTMGSLILGAGYGFGNASKTTNGIDRTIEIRKPQIVLGFAADNLFAEPYFVPYGEIRLWQMGITETSEQNAVEDKFDGETQMGMSYSVGALIQLNWLDSSASVNSRVGYGIQNTYLDIFATKYNRTQSTDDPDVQTDLDFGAGVRVEF